MMQESARRSSCPDGWEVGKNCSLDEVLALKLSDQNGVRYCSLMVQSVSPLVSTRSLHMPESMLQCIKSRIHAFYSPIGICDM
jgi:hypothetical protein